MTSTLDTLSKSFPFDDLARIRKALSASDVFTTPSYIFDPKLLSANLRRLTDAFRSAKLDPYIYYALKSNPYPGIVSTLVSEGASIDISSGKEFDIARKAGAKDFVYTGPGKTEAEMEYIVNKAGRGLFIHLESFRELQHAGAIAARSKHPLQCAVRVVPGSHTAWDKFGIPLSELKKFVSAARKLSGVELTGIQFHISYAKDASPYVAALKELGEYLGAHFSPEERAAFAFIDIGGGFYPETHEGEYPWNPEGVMLFEKPGLIDEVMKLPAKKRARRIVVDPIEKIARDIASAWKKHICTVLERTALFIEPGRFLSHNCMHLLMEVADQKRKNSVIVNAGWNMIGWEKYQYLSYVPIFNLTQWDPKNEFPCVVYGNLCLPDDIWGYYVHGKGIAPEDLLLIPYQGAYTYTYRQEFIRGVPPVFQI